MNVKCWIVCEPCCDPYYGGSPTGMVFTDEAKAKEYIEHENKKHDLYDLYLEEGLLK